MITYKNISVSTKTFYGVTFKPNDIKEVPGYINDKGMVRVLSSVKKEVPEKKRSYNKKSSTITESQPKDSTSTEDKNNNITTINKEETLNGQH